MPATGLTSWELQRRRAGNHQHGVIPWTPLYTAVMATVLTMSSTSAPEIGRSLACVSLLQHWADRDRTRRTLHRL